MMDDHFGSSPCGVSYGTFWWWERNTNKHTQDTKDTVAVIRLKQEIGGW